jgi:DNA-binding response OmpR family regulator
LGEFSLAQIRQAEWNVPILAVGNRKDARLVTGFLGAGADDYIAESTDPAMLPSRLRALIRRSGGYAPSYLQAGNLMLDVNICV